MHLNPYFVSLSCWYIHLGIYFSWLVAMFAFRVFCDIQNSPFPLPCWTDGALCTWRWMQIFNRSNHSLGEIYFIYSKYLFLTDFLWQFQEESLSDRLAQTSEISFTPMPVISSVQAEASTQTSPDKLPAKPVMYKFPPQSELQLLISTQLNRGRPNDVMFSS